MVGLPEREEGPPGKFGHVIAEVPVPQAEQRIKLKIRPCHVHTRSDLANVQPTVLQENFFSCGVKDAPLAEEGSAPPFHGVRHPPTRMPSRLTKQPLDFRVMS